MLGLATDSAADLASSSRFLADHHYDVVVADASLADEERRELFRTIATVNRDARLILAGSFLVSEELSATSLGLNVTARLDIPIDVTALYSALARAIPAGNLALGNVLPRVMNEADLSRALMMGEITFGFQPQVSLATGRLAGAEALARWNSTQYGAIPSDIFLSLVTSGSAATLLADLTLSAALAACAPWRKQAANMNVTVNFSAVSL